MSEFRPPREPGPAPDREPTGHPATDDGASTAPGVEPLRLRPLLPRRQNPWLVVEVDGSPGAHGAKKQKKGGATRTPPFWGLRDAAGS